MVLSELKISTKNSIDSEEEWLELPVRVSELSAGGNAASG
jgi:hypothetical protein